MVNKDYFKTHVFTHIEHEDPKFIRLVFNTGQTGGIYHSKYPYIIIYGPEDYMPLILEYAVNLYPDGKIYWEDGKIWDDHYKTI